jgi:hypothetical protein
MNSKRPLNEPDSAPLPANDFVERLPMRLGALAGLLVGMVSATIAKADLWFTMIEVGIAFVVFAAFGTVLRSLLAQMMANSPPQAAAPNAEVGDQAAKPDLLSNPRKPIVILPEDMEEYELRP